MTETRKREPTLFELMTNDEKAELLRNKFYWTHARRSNPGFFYETYPDLKPQSGAMAGEKDTNDELAVADGAGKVGHALGAVDAAGACSVQPNQIDRFDVAPKSAHSLR